MHLFASRLWRSLRDESGQTLLLFTILLPVLFGFAAIAIDVGILRYQHEQLQSAADAAAIAAGIEVNDCNGTSNCAAMQTAALQAMSENGYTNVTLNTQCTGTTSANGVTLMLNNSPCALGSKTKDPNFGDTNSVEAIVSKQEPTYFGRILGIDHFTLSARAEATGGAEGRDSPNCNYEGASAPGQPVADVYGAITVNSGGHFQANCGTMDASSNSAALVSNSGAHWDTTKGQNNVHGGVLLNGNGNSDHFSPTPVTNVPAQPDPLSYLKPPTNPGGCTSMTAGTGGTISPGCYSGININSGNSLTLNPGTYYITGNVTVDSGASLSGTGVTLYFASGSMTANSGSKLNLVAPTTGTYAGIVYYQDPSDQSTIIYDSGSTSVIQGSIYALNAELDLNSGAKNSAAYTIIDVNKLVVNSGAQFTINDDYSSLPGGSPIKVVGLSE